MLGCSPRALDAWERDDREGEGDQVFILRRHRDEPCVWSTYSLPGRPHPLLTLVNVVVVDLLLSKLLDEIKEFVDVMTRDRVVGVIRYDVVHLSS